MLLKDFGKDLPISGGLGQSANNPIRITTVDPMEAAITQFKVARCIYGTQGWYWRLLGFIAVDASPSRIQRFHYEVKYVEGDQVVTEERSLYYDISAVHLAPDENLPFAWVLCHPVKFGFPWHFGWFHFDELIDNEKDCPGLGVSLAYSAPLAKMTVYAYDKGMSELIKSDPEGTARSEYLQAISDFELVNPNAITDYESDKNGTLLKVYKSGNTLSVVLVATVVLVRPVRCFFAKLRLTLEAANEPFMVDCVVTTIGKFQNIVSTWGRRE